MNMPLASASAVPLALATLLLSSVFGPRYGRLVLRCEAPAPKGDRAQIVDFHLSSHCCPAAGANGLAHGLVEQRSDNASMQVMRGAFKRIRTPR